MDGPRAFNPCSAELLSGAVLALCGVWLLLPFHSFASAVTFRGMSQVAPEWVWGLYLLLLGLTRLGAAFFGYAPARRLTAILAAVTWAFIATTFLLSNPRALACVMVVSFAAFDLGIARRLTWRGTGSCT
ncbi:MAG: hypothetical protein M3315_01145 [Actinomycetota bacterium]|nr:hypothetical protein [Actinomycetota bacterium]